MGMLVDRIKSYAGDHWKAYVHHPWIDAMIRGDLSTERFRFFLVQDLPYLADFARVYFMAFAKLKPGELRVFRPFLQLLAGYDEGKWEEELLRDIGCTDYSTERWAAYKAREGYMNHLVRMAHEGTGLEALVAMLPCSMGFAELGERCHGLDLSKHPAPYQRWLGLYSRPFQRQQVNALVDGLEFCAAQASEAELAALERIFLRSIQHQVHVFDAAWRLEDPWPGPGSYEWPSVGVAR